MSKHTYGKEVETIRLYYSLGDSFSAMVKILESPNKAALFR